MPATKEVKKRIEEKLRPLNLPKTIDALRDEIWRHVERGVYSVDLVRSIEKMSANSDSPIGVLKTCFELIEHSVLIPISTFFNSAYVHGVQSENGVLSNNQDEFIKLEKRLRELQSVNQMSFGHKVEGARIFMKHIVPLLPSLHLGTEKNQIITDKEFRGYEEHEVFIVRATQMLSTLTVASGYEIPSTRLASFIQDQNPIGNLVNQKCTLEAFFNMISQCRNADAHPGEPKYSWWYAEAEFYKVMRDYIEPAVLQMLMHPLILTLLEPEQVIIHRSEERPSDKPLDWPVKHYIQRCSKGLNPRGFIQMSERARHQLQDRTLYVIRKDVEGEQASHEFSFLFPVNEFPKPTQSLSDLAAVFETYVLWFYVIDGKLSDEELRILKALADMLGIVDYHNKTNHLLVTLNAYTENKRGQEDIRKVLTEHLSFCRTEAVFQKSVQEAIRHKEILIRTIENQAKSKKGNADAKTSEQTTVDVIRTLFEHFEDFTFDGLITRILAVSSIQRQYLVEFLENEFHSLSEEELSIKSGLPKEIIASRLKELLKGVSDSDEKSVEKDSKSSNYKIVFLDGKYKTQNTENVHKFEQILQSAIEHRDNVERTEALPDFVSQVFRLCANLFQQETNNDSFIKHVARLFRSDNLPVMAIELDGKGKDNSISTRDPKLIFEWVANKLGNELEPFWRTKHDEMLFKVLDEDSIQSTPESLRSEVGANIYTFEPPYDEQGAHDFLFLLGRLLAYSKDGNHSAKHFPKLIVGDSTFCDNLAKDWGNMSERMITMFDACQDMVGKRRSTKLHFRLTYQPTGTDSSEQNQMSYYIEHRVTNMATMLAKILYSLEITAHHNITDEQRCALQWHTNLDEPHVFNESIWVQSGIEQHADWPLKTGRVRYYSNATPLHQNCVEFDRPYCYRLGETFDSEGVRALPPIEYWFEMNNYTVNHIHFLSKICEMCHVKMEEIEWYPQVRINDRTFGFTKETLGEDYLSLISYLLLDLKEEPRTDSSVARAYPLSIGVVEVSQSSDVEEDTADGDAETPPVVEVSKPTGPVSISALGWTVRVPERLTPGHRIISQHVPGQDQMGDEVVGTYIVHIPQVRRELKNSESVIEHTLTEIFGLSKGVQYSLKYRTIREIEEAERQLKAETEQGKVSEDFEEPMQDDLLTEDLD